MFDNPTRSQQIQTAIWEKISPKRGQYISISLAATPRNSPATSIASGLSSLLLLIILYSAINNRSRLPLSARRPLHPRQRQEFLIGLHRLRHKFSVPEQRIGRDRRRHILRVLPGFNVDHLQRNTMLRRHLLYPRTQ